MTIEDVIGLALKGRQEVLREGIIPDYVVLGREEMRLVIEAVYFQNFIDILGGQSGEPKLVGLLIIPDWDTESTVRVTEGFSHKSCSMRGVLD